MKKTKISLLCLFLAAAVACSASACGNGGGATESVSTPQGSTLSSVVSEIQSSILSSNPTEESVAAVDSSTTGTFDFDEVCKDIEINGKKYIFPLSINDLNQGFTYKVIYCEKNNEPSTCQVGLNIGYNDIYIIDSTIYQLPVNYYDDDEKIASTKLSRLAQYEELTNDKYFLSIAGISIKDNAIDVIKKLGTPHATINRDDNKPGGYTYYKNGSKSENYVTFTFDDNSKVIHLAISTED